MFVLTKLVIYTVQTPRRTNLINNNPVGFNYITNKPKILQCYFDYQSIKITKEKDFKVKHRIFGKLYKYIKLDYAIDDISPTGYALISIKYDEYDLDKKSNIYKFCYNFGIETSQNYKYTIKYDIDDKIYYWYEFKNYRISIHTIKNKLEDILIFDHSYDMAIKRIIKTTQENFLCRWYYNWMGYQI